MSFFDRLKQKLGKSTEAVTQKFMSGLHKTRSSLMRAMGDLFTRYRKIDEELYEELEEILIASDVGVPTTMELVSRLREEVKAKRIQEPAEIPSLLLDIMKEMLTQREVNDLPQTYDGLQIILFVGVNGVGKTTTIGKLAHRYKEQGKKVVLAAGDTFRAGAIEQLGIWGERIGVDVISHQAGSDPAAVIYDGIQASLSRKADLLLCDTAGRLQNKTNLMEELKKIHRVIQREAPDAPRETLLVLDSTTGQNALIQAKKFKEAVDVSGIVLTKLDGTAKGGIVMAIAHELQVPVRYVGLGEKQDDLQEFDVDSFLYALFEGVLTKEDE